MSQFASEKLLWTCADLIFSKHSLSTVCSYKAVLIFPFFTFLAKCIMFLVSLFKSLGNGKSIQAPAWSSAHVIWKTAFILNGNILQAFTGSQNYLEGRYEEMRIKAFWSVLASETKNEFCHLIFFFEPWNGNAGRLQAIMMLRWRKCIWQWTRWKCLRLSFFQSSYICLNSKETSNILIKQKEKWSIESKQNIWIQVSVPAWSSFSQ